MIDLVIPGVSIVTQALRMAPVDRVHKLTVFVVDLLVTDMSQVPLMSDPDVIEWEVNQTSTRFLEVRLTELLPPEDPDKGGPVPWGWILDTNPRGSTVYRFPVKRPEPKPSAPPTDPVMDRFNNLEI